MFLVLFIILFLNGTSSFGADGYISASAASTPLVPKLSLLPSDAAGHLAAGFSTVGKMKDHFRIGMKFFIKGKYDEAIPELMASTMISDPHTWDYWYAEAYATLGVIYEFHIHEPNHRFLAYRYYRLALKRDPLTFSAGYYIKSVAPQFAKHSKKRKLL